MAFDSQKSELLPSPRLSVQITQIDHILVKSGPLDLTTLPYSPVIRVFGASSLGKKACLHIHQVYPYFYIEYRGDLDVDAVNTYIRRLTKSLNHAIALSLRRKPGLPKAQYIRSIILVKGVHFYGFHASYSPFLKIMVVDPAQIHRAVSILQTGTVMGTRFRTFENHLSYILQFLCDFGLYGCGWIGLEDALRREPRSDQEEGDEMQSHLRTNKFDRSPYFRQSHLAFELDVTAPQILNRHRVAARNWHHTLQVPSPPLPQEPVILGVRELWEDERRRRISRGLHPSPEVPIDPSEGSRGKGGEWVSEARWWDQLRKKIELDAPLISPSFSTWETFAMTAFESVEALWEQRFRTWKNSPYEPEQLELSGSKHVFQESQFDSKEGEDGEDCSIEVDLKLLAAQDMSEAADIENQRAIYEEDDASDDEFDYSEDVEAEDEVLSEIGEETSLDNPFEEPGIHSPNQEYTLKSLPPYSKYSDRKRSPLTPTNSESPSDDNATPRPISPGIHLNTNLSEASAHRQYVKETARQSGSQTVGVKEGSALTEEERSADNRTPNSSRKALSERRRRIIPDPKHALTGFQTAKAVSHNRHEYKLPAPTNDQLMANLSHFSLPRQIHRKPFYSDDDDVPNKPREFAGLVYHLKGGGLSALDEWVGSQSDDISWPPLAYEIDGWEYANSPPSRKEVIKWTMQHPVPVKVGVHSKSQVKGPTPVNIYGLNTLGIFNSSMTAGKNNITILSLELFVLTNNEQSPSPLEDEITALSFAFQASDDLVEKGTILVQSSDTFGRYCLREPVEIVPTELDLLNRAIDLVNDLDPDILAGWDVQRASWGYLDARGKAYGLELPELLSRGPLPNVRSSLQWETRKTSTFKVAGRHVFNLWRLMRSERALASYTIENVVFHILKKRIPFYRFSTLTDLYESGIPESITRAIQYYSDRASFVLELIEQCELVTKTAEFARVFGVDFFSVISRGSQFKVESFMFRLAKPESFVLLSPNRRDVGRQNAAECMPLIMEPQSALYTSPLLVLDFQSLYPSVMIAYNYCYSTCLGRVRPFRGKNKFGVVPDLELPPGLLATLKNHVHIAPNGILYVNSDTRKGLLGRMLIELLETRVMVKQARKGAGNDKALRRILEARQLGLKYIANVTYGYTSATYSGRMPAVEIADSIVQSGRETLEKAIALITENKKWGAEVVYGDTDSLFIYLPGRSKDQAFQIGNDIAATITALNPSPIKLKFEKVYLPCVLIAKKRYVGFKYENPDDVDPVFDAKGIETVRRDGVPAQRKMTENILRMLFHTQDLSLIKEYCYSTWTSMLENRTSIQEFIFSKEVRMGTYSDHIPPPPGAALAARKMLLDPSREPQYGERVPYVIVYGAPGSRLTERAMDPLDVVNDSEMRVDVSYYISRVLIPPLERVLSLLGADVRQWFDEMVKPQVAGKGSPSKFTGEAPFSTPGSNLGEHFSSLQCFICGDYAPEGLCYNCYIQPQEAWTRSLTQQHTIDERLVQTYMICSACTNSPNGIPIRCESLDCPWMYSRKRADQNAEYMEEVQAFMESLLSDSDSDSSSEDDMGVIKVEEEENDMLFYG